MNFNLMAITTTTTDMVSQFLEMTDSPAYAVYSFVVEVLFWLVGHLFLSFAILYLSKKQGYKKLWLSFIPFANLILLGKVVGKTVVWGVKLKNVGFWACITSAISALFYFLINLGYYVSLFEYIFNVRVEISSEFIYSWLTAENPVWTVLYYVSSIFDIAQIFFFVSLVFLTFRLYNPQRSFLYAILSVLRPELFGIFLFVSRKNPKHVIVRVQPPQGGYYGGGFYGTPHNFNPNGQNVNQKHENPFPEFGEDEKPTDTGDDFFN